MSAVQTSHKKEDIGGDTTSIGDDTTIGGSDATGGDTSTYVHTTGGDTATHQHHGGGAGIVRARREQEFKEQKQVLQMGEGAARERKKQDNLFTR